mmetsp:Transcript_9894/g.27904  ORF Transcript_9894/g.27904 Transcript_9894/m.27904 type:complete len:230 (+) Transcript_9894:1609-2298(+)
MDSRRPGCLGELHAWAGGGQCHRRRVVREGQPVRQDAHHLAQQGERDLVRARPVPWPDALRQVGPQRVLGAAPGRLPLLRRAQRQLRHGLPLRSRPLLHLVAVLLPGGVGPHGEVQRDELRAPARQGDRPDVPDLPRRGGRAAQAAEGLQEDGTAGGRRERRAGDDPRRPRHLDLGRCAAQVGPRQRHLRRARRGLLARHPAGGRAAAVRRHSWAARRGGKHPDVDSAT